MATRRAITLFLAIIALPTILTFFSLLHSHPRGGVDIDVSSQSSNSGVRAFFSFHTPSTLFPPSAIISLTDDNSTFFLARPADFGPALAANGLSGQLWIGSGFGEDDMGRGGPGAGTEGELGCSDIPGWDDGNQPSVNSKSASEAANAADKTSQGLNSGEFSLEKRSKDERIESQPFEDDGTDDYLHHPLPSSPVAKQEQPGQSAQYEPTPKGQTTTHGDIQSLQESAEISGKIVLLSRGGCGFLEKVKWTQRRGGTALIVGDHTRGGALVTMYARGDTSNITIPSLFTSHTTAHLLSSLIPPESIDDLEQTDDLDPGSRRGDKGFGGKKHGFKTNPQDDKPTFTLPSVPQPTLGTTSSGRRPRSGKVDVKRSGWLMSAFGMGRRSEDDVDSTRPPSSGQLDWLSEKWTDKTSKDNEDQKQKEAVKDTVSSKKAKDSGSRPSSSDDFVIGVQDWRDPDLVATKSLSTKSTTKSTTQIPESTSMPSNKAGKVDESHHSAVNTLSGGSITPGSGEYQKPGHKIEPQAKNVKVNQKGEKHESTATEGDHAPTHTDMDPEQSGEEHEGLWVTLTPTTMSTSPFFDTLLVLVVSPLITLTVVYALLLLRSRIRRRRWRAPKSVVDRLPIRTYHTMSCSSTSSSRLASPHSSSPTSPLLQSNSRPATSHSRPRSATTTGVVDTGQATLSATSFKPSSTDPYEKGPESPKKRRKYTGRQVECVVCLEEYVDGHSQVMSLPCGHEFHAECITPWLTTRRRTCPICKGDVVRSMAQNSSTEASSINSPYRDDVSEGDVQVQAAETTNDSPASAIPIPRDEVDLERGDDMAATLVNDEHAEESSPRSGWRGLTSMSLSAFTGEAAWREAQADRNR